MLLLVDVARNQVLEALAKGVQLWVLIRALLADRLTFWFHFVWLAAIGGRQVPVVVMAVLIAPLIWVVLVNFRVGGPFSIDIQRFQHVLHVLELFCLKCRVYTIDDVVVCLLLLLFHFWKFLEMTFRFFLVTFWYTCKSWRQGFWNLRFHHFVESLTHFFLMFTCLNLAHCWYMTLGDLVMIFHIILQCLIIIISYFLRGNAANFWKLVSLIICLGHCYLILWVQCKFAMTSL